MLSPFVLLFLISKQLVEEFYRKYVALIHLQELHQQNVNTPLCSQKTVIVFDLISKYPKISVQVHVDDGKFPHLFLIKFPIFLPNCVVNHNQRSLKFQEPLQFHLQLPQDLILFK